MKNFCLIVCLFLSQLIYSQEEFFGNKSGISFAILHAVSNQSTSVTGGGLSIHFKKGAVAGFGVVDSNPSLSLGYLFSSTPIDMEVNRNPTKIYMGLAYSYAEKYKIWGSNFSVIKCFNMDSNFPFSISGSTSPQLVKSRTRGIYNSSSTTISDVTFVFGVGYNQAFFAKNDFVPVVGFHYSLDANDNKMYSISVAFNFNM